GTVAPCTSTSRHVCPPHPQPPDTASITHPAQKADWVDDPPGLCHSSRGPEPGGRSARLAVMLMDLDHFKEINDTLGHHVGDALLRLIGPRMADALRPEDLIVRLGGDEFAIVVQLSTGQRPEEIARRMLGQLAEPLNLDGVPLRISASIGVALYPDHARDSNGLLQRADVAMYAAKAEGGGVRRYSPERDQHSRERLRTVEELRVAIATDQLTVHYQPQCEVVTGSVRGMEALVRWNHPDRGQLPPDLFITIAEKTGLMPALTTYVLTESVRQCHQWRLDGFEVGVSVNLSASSLLDQQLPDQVSWLLTSHDLPAHALTLELTEDTMMADANRCKTTLARLKDLGVGLSIDDYGTGYCSLAYLQELPVDELKLDRAFLTDLRAPRNRAIVRSTIDLAHALGMRLVAEGVGDQPTLDHLAHLGCDTVQGYHLSRPLPGPEATTWLRKQPGTGATARLPTTFSR
ncbi:MAG: bifunctional diguanylate cyclase/phosphodiesterase, partial [Actinomycetota bacterium]|nr:bifunctional diguanylate cyclase/phosphodiesterase [Actinomycetota bacterium]